MKKLLSMLVFILMIGFSFGLVQGRDCGILGEDQIEELQGHLTFYEKVYEEEAAALLKMKDVLLLIRKFEEKGICSMIIKKMGVDIDFNSLVSLVEKMIENCENAASKREEIINTLKIIIDDKDNESAMVVFLIMDRLLEKVKLREKIEEDCVRLQDELELKEVFPGFFEAAMGVREEMFAGVAKEDL